MVSAGLKFEHRHPIEPCRNLDKYMCAVLVNFLKGRAESYITPDTNTLITYNAEKKPEL